MACTYGDFSCLSSFSLQLSITAIKPLLEPTFLDPLAPSKAWKSPAPVWASGNLQIRETRDSKRSRSNSQPSRLREEFETRHDSREGAANQLDAQNRSYKNSLFGCLVISPIGRTIKEFGSISWVGNGRSVRSVDRSFQSLCLERGIYD